MLTQTVGRVSNGLMMMILLVFHTHYTHSISESQSRKWITKKIHVHIDNTLTESAVNNVILHLQWVYSVHGLFSNAYVLDVDISCECVLLSSSVRTFRDNFFFHCWVGNNVHIQIENKHWTESDVNTHQHIYTCEWKHTYKDNHSLDNNIKVKKCECEFWKQRWNSQRINIIVLLYRLIFYENRWKRVHESVSWMK